MNKLMDKLHQSQDLLDPNTSEDSTQTEGSLTDQLSTATLKHDWAGGPGDDDKPDDTVDDTGDDVDDQAVKDKGDQLDADDGTSQPPAPELNEKDAPADPSSDTPEGEDQKKSDGGGDNSKASTDGDAKLTGITTDGATVEDTNGAVSVDGAESDEKTADVKAEVTDQDVTVDGNEVAEDTSVADGESQLIDGEKPGLNLGKLTIKHPNIDREQDLFIQEQSGMDSAGHQNAKQKRADAIIASAETHQSTLATDAETHKAQTLTELDGHHGNFQAEAEATRGSIATLYTDTRAKAATLIEGTRSTINASSDEARKKVEGTAASSRGRLSTYVTKQQGVIDATNTTEGDRVESGLKAHGDDCAKAANESSGKLTAKKESLDKDFGVGSKGGAQQNYSAWLSAKTAKEAADKGAKDMKTSGEKKQKEIHDLAPSARQAVEETSETAQQQLTAFQTSGNTAIDQARGSALQQVESDRKAELAAADQELVNINAFLDSSEAEANDQICEIEDGVTAEYLLRQDSIANLFLDAQSQSESALGELINSVREELATPILSFFTDLMPGFALIETQLLDILGGSQETLESLATRLQGDNLAFYEQQIQRLADSHLHYSDQTGTYFVEMQGKAASLGQSIQQGAQTLSDSVSTSFDKWLAPQVTTLESTISEAKTSAATAVTNELQKATNLKNTFTTTLNSTVENFVTNVTKQADEASLTALQKTAKRAQDAFKAMRGMGTDEDGLFNALRGMNPYEPAYLKELFYGQANGSLMSWLEGDLSKTELKIAKAHLNRQHGTAARLELDYNMNWYGDDEAQIQVIMRGIPEETRKTIATDPAWNSTKKALRKNLDGPDLEITNALLANNVNKADAVVLREDINKLRIDGDMDALHDKLAAIDPKRKDEIFAEMSKLDGVKKASGLDANASAEDVVSAYANRKMTRKTWYGSTKAVKNPTAEQAKLSDALIDHGADADETRVARLGVEMKRKGGPDKARIEKALYVDPALQKKLHSRDPKVREEAKLKLKEKQDNFDGLWKTYAKEAGLSEDPASGLSTLKIPKEQQELYKVMLEDGTNTPRVAAKQIDLARQGNGTDEESMERALTGMNPDEIKELQKAWQAEHGESLNASLGLFGEGSTFSELSGKDAKKFEILMQGSEDHMTDMERFKLAKLKHDHQVGDDYAGVAGDMLVSDDIEGAALDKNFKALNDFVEKNKGSFNSKGNFTGSRDDYETYRMLCTQVGITASHYEAAIDRAANYVTTAIAITAAVVATAVTGGVAGPMIAAAAGGLLSMGANRMIKGSSYGWEDAAVDLGVTALSVATAGAGAKIGTATKSFTGMKAVGTTALTQGGLGAVNNMGATAMQDATWKKGFKDGMGKVGYSGAQGFVNGGVSGGAGKFAEEFTAIGKLTNAENLLLKAAGGSINSGLSTAAGTSAQLSMDAATGTFKGELDDAFTQVTTEAGKAMGTGFLESYAEGHRERREAKKKDPKGDQLDKEIKQQEVDANDNVAAAEKVDEQVKGNKDNPKVVNDATKTVEGIADDAKLLENKDAKLREKIKQHAEEVVTRQENSAGDDPVVVPPTTENPKKTVEPPTGGGDGEKKMKEAVVPPPKEEQLLLPPGRSDEDVLLDKLVDMESNGEAELAYTYLDLVDTHNPTKVLSITDDFDQMNQSLPPEISGKLKEHLGNDVVMEHVASLKTSDEQAEFLKTMSEFESIMEIDPKVMSEQELDLVVSTQAKLSKSFEEAPVLRKVLDDWGLKNAVAFEEGGAMPVAKGFVGDARNTEGMLPEAIIAKLGLDYEGYSGTPYLNADTDSPTGYTAKDELFFVDMPMTDELRSNAKIPMDEYVNTHARTSTKDDAKSLVEGGHLIEHSTHDVTRVGGIKDESNPYNGTGAASNGTRLADGVTVANQERVLDTPEGKTLGMPEGTELKYLNSSGEVTVVATLKVADDGSYSWDYASDVPEELLAKVESTIAKFSK